MICAAGSILGQGRSGAPHVERAVEGLRLHHRDRIAVPGDAVRTATGGSGGGAQEERVVGRPAPARHRDAALNRVLEAEPVEHGPDEAILGLGLVRARERGPLALPERGQVGALGAGVQVAELRPLGQPVTQEGLGEERSVPEGPEREGELVASAAPGRARRGQDEKSWSCTPTAVPGRRRGASRRSS